MKSINIAALKNDLSRVLRRVRKGERFIVRDRDEPVAELIPLTQGHDSAHERLVQDGKLRAASKRLGEVKIKPLGREVCIQDLLDEVREDTH